MRDAARFNLELVRQFHLWMISQKYSRAAWVHYEYAAKSFAEFLKHKPVTSATHVDILEFLAAKSEVGKSVGTLHHYLHALRIFFDFLDFGGLIKQHAPRQVRMKALRSKVPMVLNEGQVSRLIAAARTPRERMIVEVLYATGCRSRELARIKVEDIDFEERKIRVIGKFEKPRFVLFGRRAGAAIRNYLKGRQVGYLLQGRNPPQHGSVCKASGGWMLSWKVYSGPHRYARFTHYIPTRYHASRAEARLLLKKLTRSVNLARPHTERPRSNSCINHVIKTLAFRAGIRSACPQMLRHTFATHLLNHNAPLRVIQVLMGHSSIKVTEIYTHVSGIETRRSYDRCHPREGRMIHAQ